MVAPTMTDGAEKPTLSSRAIDEAHSPGIWRRIRLDPVPGLICGAIEDDFHRFLLRLHHVEGVVTRLEVKGERIPWSTCGGAGAFLDEQIRGRRLVDLATINAHLHCTHQYEVLSLCAAHAGDAAPTQFDLRIHDPGAEDSVLEAVLYENGVLRATLRVAGTIIEAPADWSGRDLRKLAEWKGSLPQSDAEAIMMLRRIIHVSGGRIHGVQGQVAHPADHGPRMLGACFTFRLPHAATATRPPEWRHDFSFSGDGPLQGYDPKNPF